MAEEKTDRIGSCQANHKDEKDYRDEVVMTSGGAIGAHSADYVENDDVKDAMAAGYY